MSFRRWIFTPLLAVAAFAATATGVASQQTGTVTGRIIDAATQQPLPGAQIVVVGTTLGTLTNQEGRFLIPNVPSGARQIRAVLLGYGQEVQDVNVPAGGTAVVDFELATSAIELEGLVVSTITGEAQRARELGTNVGKIDVSSDIEATAVQTVSNVLGGRTEGVIVGNTGGAAGAGTRIRIRGANSINLSNEPLVFVDGVQISTSTRALGVGGEDPSRLNDINPGDIESIDVIKGPAATGIYGTQAANGVILITTKRGQAGTTRWNAYAELGQTEDFTDYEGMFGSYTQLGDGTEPFFDPNTGNFNSDAWDRCPNRLAAAGDCVQDVFATFNTALDGRTTMYSTGNAQRYGLNVTGGNDRVTYYLSGEYYDETGVFDWNRNNRYNLRGNLNARITDNFDFSLSTGYVYSDLKLNSNDNSIFSPIINMILGQPYYVSTPDDTPEDGVNRSNYGFGFNAVDLRKYVVNQVVNRFTIGTTMNWGITNWLSWNANGGLDFVATHDFRTVQPGDLPIAQTWALGFRESDRSNDYLYTANTSLVANYGILENLLGTSTVGASYGRDYLRRTEGYGYDLIPGTGSLGQTAQGPSVDEDFFEVKTVGFFGQQEFAWRDLMFLNLSLRGDDNSAFGERYGFIWYPNASLSWVINEEGWFPDADWFSTLRLRTAWGQSGLRPNFRDALTLYGSTGVRRDGQESAGLTLTSTGNEQLQPERTTEYELGFDMAFFQERLGVGFTYFNKKSEDALIARRLPPSLGLTASVLDNLGSIRNSGTELGINLNVVDNDTWGWDLRFTNTTLDNEIEELGEGVEPIIFNRGSQRHQNGLPAGAFYMQPVSYDDVDGNGLLSVDEVIVADTAEFLGRALPTRLNSFSTTIRLFDWFSASTLFEGRFGNHQLNDTEAFRCGFRSTYGCAAVSKQGASLEEQAGYIADRYLGSPGGTLFEADFIKWRELSFTFTTPSRWASSQAWAQGLSITLAGRNLATFTDYPGLDPETNEGGPSDNWGQSEFNTQPPVRSFLVRLNYTF
jgi:TonB-linked SusC/RagA family outer membrane protein